MNSPSILQRLKQFFSKESPITEFRDRDAADKEIIALLTPCSDKNPPRRIGEEYSVTCHVFRMMDDEYTFIRHPKLGVYSYSENQWFDLQLDTVKGGLCPHHMKVQPSHWVAQNQAEAAAAEGKEREREAELAQRVANLLENDDSNMWAEHLAQTLESVAELDDLSILRAGKSAELAEAGFWEFIEHFPNANVLTANPGEHYAFAVLLAKMDRDERKGILLSFAKALRDPAILQKKAVELGMGCTQKKIPPEFWDDAQGRWNGHLAFNTISHGHVSCYAPAPDHKDCDLTVVECADGRWYVEDNWGGDAEGDEKVWNPFNRAAGEPYFFPNEDQATEHAVEVVARISGVDKSRIRPT